MTIVCATDDNLRKHISEHECVFVTYITPDCPVCNSLMPSIRLLSQKQTYENIHFVEIDANENPVAKIEMMEKQLPFVITYKKGLLIECETVSTEYDVVHKLDKLEC
jgi:thioredoxin 1